MYHIVYSCMYHVCSHIMVYNYMYHVCPHSVQLYVPRLLWGTLHSGRAVYGRHGAGDQHDRDTLADGGTGKDGKTGGTICVCAYILRWPSIISWCRTTVLGVTLCELHPQLRDVISNIRQYDNVRYMKHRPELTMPLIFFTCFILEKPDKEC